MKEKSVKKVLTRFLIVGTVVVLLVVGFMPVVLMLTGIVSESDNTGSLIYDEDNIPIFANRVADFCYDTQSNRYYLEYRVGLGGIYSEWYITGHVNKPEDSSSVFVYCTKEVFSDYREWYSGISPSSSAFREKSDMFHIQHVEAGEKDNEHSFVELVKN